MSHVTINIDGIDVKVPKGTSVLKAAEQIGINIPALCYDPELSLSGSCRMCIVEIEGMRNLPTSCTTEVVEGMSIKTHSNAVIESRKTILELLIADHPLDCMVCQKNGDCLLQKYAYEYNVRNVHYTGRQHDYPIEDNNPFIVREMNKCIKCSKCVRVCSEIQGRDILQYSYRGFDTKIATAMDKPLIETDCVFCGSCVAVCPTGALLEKQMIGKGRRFEIDKVKTTCPFCGVGCNFDLNVKDGKVIGVTSNETSVVNGRHLCVKGRFGTDYINSPDRITTPLIRKGDEFVEASWDEALDLVASKFMDIKQDYGNDSIGVLSSARCTNEENYLMQKFVRGVIGNNNIDHCART